MLNQPIAELPESVSPYAALETAYRSELSRILMHISQERNIIIRTEKLNFPYLNRVLRKLLEDQGFELVLISGRNEAGGIPSSRVQNMVRQFEEAVNSYDESTVFLFPYIDILTSSRHGLSNEGREILTLIHENPGLRLIALEDPEFPLHSLVVQAFFSRISLEGVSRHQIVHMITRNEARRLGVDTLPVLELHRLLGSQSPVAIRKILEYITTQEQPGPSTPHVVQDNLRTIRSLTLSGDQTLSPVSLKNDIAGYAGVKDVLEKELLDLWRRSRELESEDDIKELESLLPRGIIFHGPPGTGKTLFARAIAHEIQGTVHVVHGPELKSQWVGEGEANIRRLFARARNNAPSVIVFDELDSLASSREHSQNDSSARTMVNQLLTEMDGFRPDEPVFIVGTTNFVQALDPALLRPGRFQLKIEVPYPGVKDRLAILELWNNQLNLRLDENVLNKLSDYTGRPTRENTSYAGDHLRALCKSMKRWMIRDDISQADWQQVQHWLKDQFYTGPREGREELSFDDVAGFDRMKKRLQQDFLDIHRKIAESSDLEQIRVWEDIVPKGILLYGPPGTGKTHLARALAGEWGARTELVNAPEILSKWVGQGEENIRDLFARAKSNAPTVIILDEIDALGKNRESESSSTGRGILLQLMTELSGLSLSDRVLVVAATNRPEDLDPALLRPGRLGTPLLVDYPGPEDIRKLIKYFVKRYKLRPDEEALQAITDQCEGITARGTAHSPDDIRALCQHLKRRSIQSGGEVLSAAIVRRTLNETEGGRSMTTAQRKRIAVHECGHVLATVLCNITDTIEEVRLKSSADSHGYMRQKASDSPFYTESDLVNDITVSLGGRAAEYMIYGEGSTGCSNDLEQASSVARQMIGRLGMGPEALPMVYGQNMDIDPVHEPLLLSRIQTLIAEREQFLNLSFTEHRSKLLVLADLLVEKSILSREDIRNWASGLEETRAYSAGEQTGGQE